MFKRGTGTLGALVALALVCCLLNIFTFSAIGLILWR